MQEHGNAEMGPTKSSPALEAYWYSKYDKMKDLKNMITDTKVLHTTQHLQSLFFQWPILQSELT